MSINVREADGSTLLHRPWTAVTVAQRLAAATVLAVAVMGREAGEGD
jgi:hypothetical protein